MSRAEEQALKAYPNIKIGEQHIDQSPAREVYVQGYEQAQKDIIEDINDALELIFAYSLIPYKDGNQWCVLLGKNIQEGICGFGNTRLDAIMNFCKEYNSYPYSIAEFLISNGYV